MMNGHRISLQLPHVNISNLGIPLLDDEFDTEDEIFEHSDLTSLHSDHDHVEDDFFM